MKPTISIVLITFGLVLAAPGAATDYLQCEAMRRRLNAALEGRQQEASSAKWSYWRRVGPPRKPPFDEECLKKGGSKLMCANRFEPSWLPESSDPRYAEGERIFREILAKPRPLIRRITADMDAAGCF